ncbi:hypothetical protein HNQ08_005550 [Deinococcus humi]|uniref:Uncharacterized protein n=1 Tax=Deinococcus humi TaxID=662880 RepID=A0A7W8NHD0_9DEIO|nr:hypothetical protein [Deinococcus humi]
MNRAEKDAAILRKRLSQQRTQGPTKALSPGLWREE